MILAACSRPIALQSLAACTRFKPALPEAVADSTALRAPDGSVLPADDPRGPSIRRGHAILAATCDSLPRYAGNGLRCTSCHLDDGRRPNALPFTGVYARFPQYRARAATVQRIEDRINDCFLRSLNGHALPLNDPAMRDIVAYFAWISTGVAVGGAVPGVGLPPIAALNGDTAAGSHVFVRECARCHGGNGDGSVVGPALWGTRSFNIGAGMARLRTAAAFIRHNMPFDRPGTLSDDDALNVAAYIVSRPRPDFAGKENDWPRGGAPPDAPYGRSRE